MLQFSRGQKAKLADITPNNHLNAGMSALAPGLTLDFSCFGVDAAGNLSDDRYFIFYNQPASPEGALKQLGTQLGDAQAFEFDLSILPASIQKLVFVLTIDGQGTLSQLSNGHFRLLVGTSEVMRFNFQGSDFQTERALIVAEVYLKDVWRVAAVGQGFAGGLSALLKHFGGQESNEDTASPAAQPAANPDQAPAVQAPAVQAPAVQAPAVQAPAAQASAVPQVSLSKDEALQIKLEKQAPQLVNLSKTLAVSLQKTGLQDVKARVALVLDASGSMRQQYRQGGVQAVVDRIATLAMRWDDDGELDAWAFALRHTRLPVVTLANIQGYIDRITRNPSKNCLIGDLGGTNNEPPVMQEVLDYYRHSSLPALVVFISDGGVKLSGEIKRLVTESANFPIFWQFVGLGGRNYGILESLDTMEGRTVDNANFFHVDDLNSITDEELYHRLLNEFPAWLRAAGAAGVLR